jgi:hypothetical protein
MIPNFVEDLLPELEISHKRKVHHVRKNLVDLVRTVSDGQSSIVFTLNKNTKNGVDPRQFLGTVVFEARGKLAKVRLNCLDLDVQCRSGALSLANRVRQRVAVCFNSGSEILAVKPA